MGKGYSVINNSPHTGSVNEIASNSGVSTTMKVLIGLVVIVLIVLIIAGIAALVCKYYEKHYECLLINHCKVPGERGRRGYRGLPGRDGQPGYNGECGLVGCQGAQGKIGVQGFTGDQGTQGTQGVPGQQGISGAAGSQGSQGQAGIDGQIGTQGSQGRVGATGSVGSSAILTFAGHGSLVLDILDGNAFTLGADSDLNANMVLFNKNDTFLAQAGMAYVRMPRSGILANLFFSVQFANPIFSIIPTQITATAYIAATGTDPFNIIPTFSVTGVSVTATVPLAQTFAANAATFNSVSVNAGDFICLVISTPVGVSSALVTLQGALEYI